MTQEEWAVKLHKWFQERGNYACRTKDTGFWVCLDDTWDFNALAEFIMKEIAKENT